MAIQMRRGQLANYDKSKMLPGEWGISIDNDSDNQKAFISFAPGVSKEVMMVEDAEEQIAVATAEAIDMATEEAEAWAHGNSFHVNDYASGDGSTKSFTLAETPSSILGVYVDGSSVSAYTLSGKTITFTTAPASGSNNIRVYYTVNTTTDNAKYYKEQAEEVAESIPEDYSELSDDVDQLKNALTAVEIVDTASGAIASFADGSDGLPVNGLTVQMEPIQAGSGDPSPDNVRPISGRDSVTVTRTGKNIWDEEWELGGINSSTGVPVGTTDTIRSKNFCSCMPSTAYYGFDGSESSGVAVYIWYYDAEKSFISGAGISNLTFTTPSNARYFKLSTYGGGYTTYKSDISINYPSTDHDYHAYQGQSIEIQLGQTVYGGTLDVTQGVLTVDRALVTLDGSDDESFTTGSYGMPFKMTLPNDALLSTDSTKLVGIFSNQMTEVTQSSTWGVNCTCSMVANNTRDLFFKLNDDLTEVSALRTYLASNPMQLCYKLAQPLTVQLTAQQLITLLGQNNVWSDADSVAVDYVADTKLYIAKVIADALA